MKRFLIGFGYGIVGLVVATGLTLGTYAIAGQDLSRPAQPIGAGKALAPHKPRGPSHPPDNHRVDQRHQTLELSDLPVSRQVLTGSSSDGGSKPDGQIGGGTSGGHHSDGGGSITILAPTPQPSPVTTTDDPSPDNGGGVPGSDDPPADGADD